VAGATWRRGGDIKGWLLLAPGAPARYPRDHYRAVDGTLALFDGGRHTSVDAVLAARPARPSSQPAASVQPTQITQLIKPHRATFQQLLLIYCCPLKIS